MDRSAEHFEPDRTYQPVKSPYSQHRYASMRSSFGLSAREEAAIIASFEKKNDALKQRVAKLEADRDTLRRRLSAASDSLDLRTTRIEKLEADRDTLNGRLAGVLASLDQRTKRVEKLEADREGLRARLAK